MLGTINGASINRVVLNGRGGEALSTADLIVTQASATASAGGTVSVSGSSVHAPVMLHVLDGATALAGDAAWGQPDQPALLDGSVGVASMADFNHDDHTLEAAFRQILQRTPSGSDVVAHAPGSGLTRHVAGSSLTVH